jgi:hypothetical protein
VLFCEGDNGGRGCKCPKSLWWPCAWLGYKLRLGAFGCPIGKFDARWSCTALAAWGGMGMVIWSVWSLVVALTGVR